MILLSIKYDEAGNVLERVIENQDKSIDAINYENGVEIRREKISQAYPPLDSSGSLATLLVVEGVLPLQDAANAIQEAPEHLVAEAEAWSLG